jgi:hypothetical protein
LKYAGKTLQKEEPVMKLRSLILTAGAVLAALAPPLGAALPAYLAKPAAWTSKLATDAGPFVTDVQLAQWVQAAQGNPPRFSFLGAFHQCYGGGFLTELANQGVVKFGANSASRYFEPAYYDLFNMRSYFTWAWGWRALNPAMGATDLTITDDAYALLQDGVNPPPVPDNPFLPWENAQYLSDPAAAAPPEKLRAAQHNYAILFVGRPDGKDLNDTNQIYDVLFNYGYARGDVYILYGNGAAPAVAPAWAAPDAAATAANLQAAFANWLAGKLNAQPQGDTAQVFFWGGDHGAADFPILISADNLSVGVPGSGVNNRAVGGQPVGPVVYEAGGGTNRGIWEILGGADVDAIAFSERSVQQWFGLEAQPEREPYPYPYPYPYPPAPGAGGWVYFSVDRPSQGVPGSDVNREIAAGRSAAADVYTMTQNSNRLAYDATDSLGLLKMPRGNDELDALSLRNTRTVLHPVTRLPNRPFFFSFLGSSQVWVFDPVTGAVNLYYDFTWSFDAAPHELDALALWDDGVRDPATNLLFFDPWSDQMLFSVGRGEAAAPWNMVQPCDILKLGADPAFGSVLTQWRFCRNLGLVPGPGKDNLDALDLGIGTEGQPVPDYPEDEYDMYPPYEWPPYPPSPGMIPPGGPYPGSHAQAPPFVHIKGQVVKDPPPPPAGF